ncbi:MAG: hypothetical protein OXU77_17160 [Gammaproteobacteria bacterium]|nr:hypothetical protein [Gammaproteobacteria bacterium]MDE0443017.1 hypothetical protein [Gammaproteobacteria bacterium]
MERVEDAIGGKVVAVVYDAPQLPLPTTGSRWARSRQLHRFARANRASHLLRVRDASGDADTWWAGRSGVSFAAAIDAWAETEAAIRDDIVLVPLDKRIYAAELEDRLVEKEHVVGAARLKEMMARWQQRPVRAFAGGAMGRSLGEPAPSGALPFDPRMHRFRPMPIALTAAGLFAPAQMAAAAAVAAVAALPQFDLGRHEHWNDADRLAEAAAREHAAMLEGSYGAATVLRGLAEVGWHDAALLMHRDGLTEMRLEDAYEISFSGTSPGLFPEAAARYASAYSASFNVSGERWVVRRPVFWGGAEKRSVEGFRSRRLAQDLHAGANGARAEVKALPGVSSGPTEERSYALRIAAATPRDLAFLADALAGRPFGLSHARCTFAGYMASACEIGIVTKGMAE